MKRAAISVFSIGIYMILCGVSFFAIPNLILSFFGMTSTEEVWIRIVGMLVLFLGIYYVVAARKDYTDFFEVSIYLRTLAFLIFLSLVLTKLAEPPLILFGIIDLAGAIWTFWAIRSSRISKLHTPQMA